MGLVFLILSVTIFFNFNTIVKLITLALGFMVALNGIRELQNAVDAHRLHIERSWIVIIVAVINLVLGIVLMVNPFTGISILLTFLGIGLIISGAADLVTSIVVAAKNKSEVKQQTVSTGE